MRLTGEHRKLLQYAVVIVLTAPVISGMLTRAWGPERETYQLLLQLQELLLLTPGVPAMAAMAAFGLALFITVLVIFSMDVRKRFQGVLLSVGTVLVILQLAAANILVPSINPFDRLAAGGIILGVGLGLALEWEKITTVDLGRSSIGHACASNGHAISFRRATRMVFGLVTAVIVWGLAQSYIAGLLQFFDPVASGAFVLMLSRFVEYDATHSFQVLGPKQAGKSMFLLGLYQQRRRAIEAGGIQTAPNPSPGMRSLLSRLSGYDPAIDGWPTAANPVGERGLRRIWFSFTANRMFPVELTLTAIDHGGEHLRDIAERLRPETLVTDGGEEDAGDSGVSSFDLRDRLRSLQSDDDDDGEEGAGSSMEVDGVAEGEDQAAGETDGTPADDGDESTTSRTAALRALGRSPTRSSARSDEEPAAEPSDKADVSSNGESATGSLTSRLRSSIGDSGDDDGAAPETPPVAEDATIVTMDQFFTEVTTADTLIMLIDCERIIATEDGTAFNDTDLHIEEFDTIVQSTDGPEVILVATKADFLFSDFDYGGYNYDLSDDPAAMREFREYITDTLRRDDSISYLIADAGVDAIYPVFFVTTEVDGQRLPELDKNGRPIGVGFDEVLSLLEEAV